MCKCGAYKFPHRMMGGQCDGVAFVSKYFDRQRWAECRSCMLFDPDEPENPCQVLLGLEPPTQCQGLQELIQYESIRLYGVNK